MKTEQYRFETGTLYEFNKDSNDYIAVWTNAFDNTKSKAIESYENSFLSDE